MSVGLNGYELCYIFLDKDILVFLNSDTKTNSCIQLLLWTSTFINLNVKTKIGYNILFYITSVPNIFLKLCITGGIAVWHNLIVYKL